MNNIEKATKQIEKVLDKLSQAYWTACDAERRAVDPDELKAPPGVLDDAYDTALRVEDIAAGRKISWEEARQFV